jgi:transposase
MQIKFLAKQCLKNARIARMCGVSRQTVYNHLDRAEPFPKPREVRPSKLDAYKDYIGARLERFDLPATVLYAELVARGYAGGLTILRSYMRPLKHEFVRRLTERFETLPGQQAQIDWGECGMVTVEGRSKSRERRQWGFVPNRIPLGLTGIWSRVVDWDDQAAALSDVSCYSWSSSWRSSC